MSLSLGRASFAQSPMESRHRRFYGDGYSDKIFCFLKVFKSETFHRRQLIGNICPVFTYERAAIGKKGTGVPTH
jgi:hypothetical protein